MKSKSLYMLRVNYSLHERLVSSLEKVLIEIIQKTATGVELVSWKLDYLPELNSSETLQQRKTRKNRMTFFDL